MASSAAFTAGEALVLNAATNAMRNSGAVGSVAVGGAATSNVALRVGGSNALWVASNAAVGIGTSAPMTKLQIVQGSSSATYTGNSAYGAIHIVPSVNTSDYYTGITFGGIDQFAGLQSNVQAGIICQSSGSYGTKLRFLTSANYSLGMDERMVIDHRGYVGIGTNGPTFPFHVNTSLGVNANLTCPPSSTVGPSVYLDASSVANGRKFLITSTLSGNDSGVGKLQFYDDTAFATRMVIDATGRIGIGLTAPAYRFDLRDSESLVAEFRSTSTVSGEAGTISAGNTSSVDRAIYMGWDNLSSRCIIGRRNTSQVITFSTFGSGNIRFVGYGGGTLTTDSSGNISSTSDSRVKQNIAYLETPSLAIVNQLKPASFELLSDVGRKRLGFIAQDVETVIPDAVDGKKFDVWYKRQMDGSPELDENGNLIFEPDAPIRPRSLDTTGILAHAVKAIQELSAENTALKTALDALTARVTALESRA